MITITQRNKMKKAFKNGYVSGVQEILNTNKITNKSGNQHSLSYICQVFNGQKSDLNIENALIELYSKKREQLAKIRAERKKIFDTKKPEARTSGSI